MAVERRRSLNYGTSRILHDRSHFYSVGSRSSSLSWQGLRRATEWKDKTVVQETKGSFLTYLKLKEDGHNKRERKSSSIEEGIKR